MGDFQREERYVVVKLKDLDPVKRAGLAQYLDRERIPTREAVVVEPDWGPIYEQTWEAIERHAQGLDTPVDVMLKALHQAQVDALNSGNRPLANQIMRVFRELEFSREG